ncbi:hypothetical protein BBP40_008478 [Aspergillus hancockii]|nr:hypothetical protein BBP40_008478 [Aspergillus hancockii]
MVEINVGIICACLPVLRPLILHVFPQIFATKNSSGRQQGPSNENSYSMKNSRKKVIQSWDHLTTLNTTAAQEREGDVESVKTIAKNDEGQRKPNIMITTNYSITEKGNPR